MVFGLVSLINFGESSLVFAAEKPIRFWNLTSATVTELRLAPAGSQNFGPDQCKNDKDGSVDHDERRPITGVTPGRTARPAVSRMFRSRAAKRFRSRTRTSPIARYPSAEARGRS